MKDALIRHIERTPNQVPRVALGRLIVAMWQLFIPLRSSSSSTVAIPGWNETKACA